MARKDSANKKLHHLFDKEPRWLHPKNEDDMIRRCEELARSWAGSSRRRSRAYVRQHAMSDPPPPSQETFENFEDSFPRRQRSTSEVSFTGILRRSTVLSTSSTSTTGTFTRLLPGHSDYFRQNIKRLVKRYTGSFTETTGISPLSEFTIPEMSWLQDPDAPRPFPHRPFPLPGDFLGLDDRTWRAPCFPNSDEHKWRWCLCYADSDISSSPWAVADELSPQARRILTCGGIDASDIWTKDAFDNTVLHFLAARPPMPMPILLQALQSNLCTPILDATNSGGQTFLHVLHRDWFQSQALFQLLDILRLLRFNFYARDHYGRNFFHMMLLAAPPQVYHYVAQGFDASLFAKRDAFNVVPMPPSATEASLLQVPAHYMARGSQPPLPDSEITDSELVYNIRMALDCPEFEDARGRNGLHCLGMAALSQETALRNLAVSRPGSTERATPRGRDTQNLSDSCKDRLDFRHRILEDLFAAGVDPNHYDKDGHTPLMIFAAQLPEDDDYKTGPAILEHLARRGAAVVRARSRAGETALHVAVRAGRKLAARTLVKEGGANVHARDAAGRSVLDVADAKVAASRDRPREYAHFEACRAWLSGGQGLAKQDPTVLDEWGVL